MGQSCFYVKCVESDNLWARSDKNLFMGYPKETRGYYFYHPKEQKVFVLKLATFLEKEFSGSKIEHEKVQDP